MIHSHRGFTLLIALILASVAVAIGLALADIAYKQVVLSATAKQSQSAFYYADSAMECALYYDQQFAAFNPGNIFDQGTIRCWGLPIQAYTETAYQTTGLQTTFDVGCPSGTGTSARVTVYKAGTGTCVPGKRNCIYTTGYNTCTASDPNRFERGLKVLY